MWKRYTILFLLGCLAIGIYAQQLPTKEQLLKLFYDAHTAKKNNDIPKAIASYQQILRLSPGLPEPYLQLGNLYETNMNDVPSLQKACLCYTHYLTLKPETTDASRIREKIESLTRIISSKEEVTAEYAVDTKDTPSDVPQRQETQMADLSIQTIAVPMEVEMDTVTAHSLELMPVDTDLIGRWVSDEMGSNGREMWIFDFLSVNQEMSMQLNDSSFVKHSSIFSNVPSLWTSTGKKDGDESVFTFEIRESKAKNPNQSSTLLDDFEDIVNKIFNVNWQKLTESSQAKDNVASTGNTTDSTDITTDSLRPADSVRLHEYEFRLKKISSNYMTGILHKRIKDLTDAEQTVSAQTSPIELFKAPDSYTGFCFTPMSKEEKASKREFRILLNEKTQEAIESPAAVNDVGCLYASGIGTHQNIKMAVAYFMEASMKNNLFATLNLAQLYATGIGIEKDLEKARELYQQAYESGYTDAMVFCGDTFIESTSIDENDYKNALACYHKAVFKRCPYAAYRLGRLYNEGIGVAKDEQNALKYYIQAADMQYADAMAELGHFYRIGKSVGQDYSKALELLHKAAAKGNAQAMYELSQMYLRGEGIEADFKQSREWLTKAKETEDKLVEGFNTLRSRIKSILTPKS